MKGNLFDLSAEKLFKYFFSNRGKKDLVTLPRHIEKLKQEARRFAEREFRPPHNQGR